MKTINNKLIPAFKSNQEAEEFVAKADLSEYDLSAFQPMHFEFVEKDASINMRIPSSLLAALKIKAKAKGTPYTRYIRLLIEKDIHFKT